MDERKDNKTDASNAAVEQMSGEYPKNMRKTVQESTDVSQESEKTYTEPIAQYKRINNFLACVFIILFGAVASFW